MISTKFKIITVAVVFCTMVCVNSQKFGDKIKKPNASSDSIINNNNTKNNSNGLREVSVSASEPKRKQVSNAGKRPSDKKQSNNKGYAEVKVFQYSMSHSDENDDMLPLNQQQINYRVGSNDPKEFERQFRMIASGFPKASASDHYQIPVYKAPKAPRTPNAPKIEFVERNFQERHDDHQQRQNHHQPQHQHQNHQQHNNHRPQQQNDNYHHNHHQNHNNHRQQHHQQQHQPQQHHHNQDGHQQYHQPQQQQQRHHQQSHHNDHNHHNNQQKHKNNRNSNHNTIQTNSGLSFDIPRGFPHPNDDKRAKFNKQLMGEENREGKPWGAQMSYSYRDPKNPKNYVEVKEMHVNVNKENAMSPQESANQLQKLLQASQGNTYGLFASRPFDGQNPFLGRPSNLIVNDNIYEHNEEVDDDDPRFPF